MKFPQLVLPQFCQTPITITVNQEGVSEEEIIEKFEMTDMLQDDFHKNDKVKEVNHTKEMSGYILERKKDAIEEIKDEYYDKMPETLTLQNKFLKNAIPIILSEKKVDLSSKELDNLLVISDEKKFLIDRNVNSYFNSLSKNSENIYDEFNTKRNYESFSKSEYSFYVKQSIDTFDVHPFMCPNCKIMMDIQEIYVSSDWYGRTIHKIYF